ncbi:MAG: hypothetical protein ACYC4K_06695 [Thiobacillus sp.]
MRETGPPASAEENATHKALARLVFFTFLLTFISARILVILIMSRRLPDFFLHIGGTHIHHLNYGIFLLCATGAYLLFVRPTGGRLRMAAVLYAMGLALTFDEFGMWLNLGGSYWQRSSYDAVAVIIGFLGFIAYFPSRRALRQQHWLQAATAVAAFVIFLAILSDSFNYVSQKFDPSMEQVESQGPK